MTEKERAVKYQRIAWLWFAMTGSDDAWDRYIDWCFEYDDHKYDDWDGEYDD